MGDLWWYVARVDKSAPRSSYSPYCLLLLFQIPSVVRPRREYSYPAAANA